MSAGVTLQSAFSSVCDFTEIKYLPNLKIAMITACLARECFLLKKQAPFWKVTPMQIFPSVHFVADPNVNYLAGIVSGFRYFTESFNFYLFFDVAVKVINTISIARYVRQAAGLPAGIGAGLAIGMLSAYNIYLINNTSKSQRRV